MKVFGNELRDEDEKREGKEEDEGESEVVTRLRVYYAFRFRENITHVWIHGCKLNGEEINAGEVWDGWIYI